MLFLTNNIIKDKLGTLAEAETALNIFTMSLSISVQIETPSKTSQYNKIRMCLNGEPRPARVVGHPSSFLLHIIRGTWTRELDRACGGSHASGIKITPAIAY